jgi:hypothetical protein
VSGVSDTTTQAVDTTETTDGGVPMTTKMHTASEAQEAGIFFYENPESLTPEHIDPLIFPIVKKINESGWVWTAESCQGHPDSTDKYVWAGNMRPMLRLVVREERVGEMLNKLLESSVFLDEDALALINGIEIWQQQRMNGWVSLTTYIAQCSTIYYRNKGLECYDRFATSLQESIP